MNNAILYRKLFFITESIKRKNANDKNMARGQGRILLILNQKDGLSTKELAEIMNIKVTSLNETLNKLIRKGYIKKEVSPKDKRVLLIYLTDKGREYKFKSPEGLDIFDCLDDGQKESLNQCLDLISEEIHERFKKENPEKYENILKKRNEIIEKYFDGNFDDEKWCNLFDKK